MPNGRPFISQAAVRDVLDSLLYSSTEHGENPLIALQLVDQFLSNPDLPRISPGRAYALRKIVVTIISNQLAHHRRMVGALPPDSSEDYEQAVRALSSDVEQGSFELTIWSLLYYRYVRIDLDFRPHTLCEKAHIDDRTLRRYFQHAFHRLADCLADEEWAVRAGQRRRRMCAEMPRGIAPLLIGRESALEEGMRLLNMHHLPHIQITGERGIGKSNLAEGLLHRLIEADAIDRVVWVAKPDSVQQALEIVATSLLPEDSRLPLQEYLQVYRVVVVFDNADRLLDGNMNDLRGMLDSLAFARVLLIVGTYMPIPDLAHISLSGISKDHIDEFVQATLAIPGDRLDGVVRRAVELWEPLNGNPLAIQLALRNPARISFRSTSAFVLLHELYEHAHDGLNMPQRRLWYSFALFPPKPVSLDWITAVWPEWIDCSEISTLVGRHLLQVQETENDGVAYSLAQASQEFIRKSYQNNPHVKDEIDTLIRKIDTILLTRAGFSLALAATILSDQWNIDPPTGIVWVRACWEAALDFPESALWLKVISNIVENSVDNPGLDLHLAYGVYLRRFGEEIRAITVFENVVKEAGRTGDFPLQARSLVELVICHRRRGAYRLALKLADKAESIAQLYSSEGVLNSVYLEYAQIAIERKDTEMARELLTIHSVGHRFLLLKGEMLLLTEQLEECWNHANQLLNVCGDTIRPHVHALLGRVCQQRGDVPQAHYHFCQGVMELEQRHDPFALARLSSNLAVVLIQMRVYDDAQRLLEQAKQTQTILGDRVGLGVTMHNLQLLRRQVIS